MSENNKPPDPNQSSRPVANLVEAAFYRPKMYTINGTLEEVGAFLEGFYSGIAKCTCNQGALQEVESWTGFCNWLLEKEDLVSSGYYELFSGLRQRYVHDEIVFAKLRVWYREYLESREGEI